MAPSLQVDFIGIGAPKCGTTWLFYALGQHPQICLSEPKEPRYFSRADLWPPYSKEETEVSAVSSHLRIDLASYARHYRHCRPNAIKGEFSTDYMYSKEAPSRIHRSFPHVKLLVWVRNPVDWAYSWYLARRDYYMEAKFDTFEDQIQYDSGFLYVGYYAKYLKRYLQYFAKEQIKIIQFEHICKNPSRQLRTCLAS